MDNITPGEMVFGKYYTFYTRNYAGIPVKLFGKYIGSRFAGQYAFSNVIVNLNPGVEEPRRVVPRITNYSVRNVSVRRENMSNIQLVPAGTVTLIYSLSQALPHSADAESISGIAELLDEEGHDIIPTAAMAGMKESTETLPSFFGGKKHNRKSRRQNAKRQSRKQRRK